jgi:hypothetical protein
VVVAPPGIAGKLRPRDGVIEKVFLAALLSPTLASLSAASAY